VSELRSTTGPTSLIQAIRPEVIPFGVFKMLHFRRFALWQDVGHLLPAGAKDVLQQRLHVSFRKELETGEYGSNQLFPRPLNSPPKHRALLRPFHQFSPTRRLW
jgi:hypothetical protein